MRILAIETSCDETAIAIVDAKEKNSKINFEILGEYISSQINIHKLYGGVYPMMAKREHSKNIFHIFEKVLKKAKLFKSLSKEQEIKNKEKLEKILEREPELLDTFLKKIGKIKKPKIDALAVTTGPGLEPALWVGISFAKALSVYWNVPLVPVNHMEGHIFSIFPQKNKRFIIDKNKNIFPLLSLLVSGGHTELVLIKDWPKLTNRKIYKKIGQTRDDAVGEAFDKVARMLGLPYPGGPQISKLAEKERKNFVENNIKINLPRPMIHSKNYDFSFSGLKTAVLYLIRDLKIKNPNIMKDSLIKNKIAREFEDAVIETLVSKTIRAIKEYKIKTLIVGGGVSANKYLKNIMNKSIKENKLETRTYFPNNKLTGDNALMISISGYFQYKNNKIAKDINKVKAKGNLSL